MSLSRFLNLYFNFLTLLYFFFSVNPLQAVIVDPKLLEGLDGYKLKKEHEHFNLLHGALLLQTGVFTNICNYPIADENKKNFS